MSFCINCGQQLPDGAKFCAECGSPVQVSAQSQRKTVYDGEIHKCPNCGENVAAFLANCPSCQYEFRGENNRSTVQQLAQKLQALEAQRPAMSGKRRSIFAQVYGERVIPQTDEKKINEIRNFVIPNTKEDILEFAILAASNIDLKAYGIDSDNYYVQRAISDAWIAKLEQAHQKARIMFGDRPEFFSIDALYSQKQKEIKKKKRELLWLILGIFGAMGAVAGLCLFVIALSGGFS